MKRLTVPLSLTTLALIWGASQWAASRPKKNGAFQPDDRVTVTVRARLSADTHYRDGGVTEDEKVAISYAETSVHSILSSDSSTCDLKEFSHSGLVEAEGAGAMAYGPGLPSLDWSFACRQPEKSLIRLALSADRAHGSVGLEDFLAYQSAEVRCTGGDSQQWRPMGLASGLLQEAWSGFCQANSQNLPSLALPFRMRGDSRVATLNYVFPVQGEHGQGKLTFDCTILVGKPGEKKSPGRIRAVPQVAASVVRGETLVLDGSRSIGDIKSYRWTFLPAENPTGLNPARTDAHKEGDVARVILLDSIKVKLTVSDGLSSDSKTVSVSVVPRATFRTPVTHHAELQVSSWDLAPMPQFTAAGGSNLEQATFKNDCESDPGQALDHVIHPNLDQAAAQDYFKVDSLDDPGGPFDGYSYFAEWKCKIQRKTLVSKWLLPEGPPVVAGMTNWYNQNGQSTAMYFLRRADTAARLQTGRIRDYVANQEQNASAPASWAEKSYGGNSAELTTKALGKLVEFEAKLRPLTHAKVMVDAPPIQVWDPNSGQWKKVQVAF